MLTASWFTYSGPGRIAICRGRPRRVGGYRRFPALNPGPWFRSVDPPTYIHRYRAEVLERLDPQETWDALRALVWPAEPVLMCFERPPFSPTCWCHRRLIAGWFRAHLGVEVAEHGYAGDELPIGRHWSVYPPV